MVDIKIYGTETPSYQLAKSKLMDSLEHARIPYSLEEIHEISQFIKDRVVSVPAVKVNGKHLFELKKNGSYNQSLRETIQSILKMEQYGNLTKIVVPTDFSDASFNAYNYANYLAKQCEGILLLTHVYFPTSTDVNNFAMVNPEIEAIHRQKLDSFVKSVNQDWIGTFVTEPIMEGVFKVGFPKAELLEMSKEKNTIMVMGTTGAGDVFKKIFGSLSLDLVENAHCPLFLVPPDAVYVKNNEVVYLSEDLKKDALHLLYVGKLCQKLNCMLKLVHFRKEKDESYNVSDAIGLLESYYPELKYHIEINDTDNIFDSLTKLFENPNYQLLAMSTQHRNLFQSLFHRSVTEFAAQHVKTPLLVLSDYAAAME
jgi:nucleotide-binding universal stress UspA family protein